MPIYVYLAAGGVVGSVFILKWGLASSGPRSRSAVRDRLGPRVSSSIRLEQDSLGQRISKRFDRIPVLRSTDELARRIARAGLPWRAANVQLVKISVALGSVVLGLLILTASHQLSTAVLVWLLGLGGTMVPEVRIAQIAEDRQRGIELELPDLLDRLTISMEAGLGFDSALAHVISEKSGPCHDEFRRVLQDLQLGVPRDTALASLSERTTVADLRLVVAAILQSGRYGLPLSNVLRVQTIELRDKRWARAQERAMKIPVKVLLPLIFCILPTLFLVLIGPALLRAARTGF
jgi:tight adherence protein C